MIGLKNKFREVKMIIRAIFLIFIILLMPIYFILAFIILIFSGWPVIFIQERVGFKGKIFNMYKFRTMRVGADKEQYKLKSLNEADGPVFKIRNDPRFTNVGKFLSHSGLDELPQLFNIVKGDMGIIGPRPLPVDEEKRISLKFKNERRLVLPGIISTGILGAKQKNNFNNWMKSDIDYIKNKSICGDIKIFFKGEIFLIKLFWRNLN